MPLFKKKQEKPAAFVEQSKRKISASHGLCESPVYGPPRTPRSSLPNMTGYGPYSPALQSSPYVSTSRGILRNSCIATPLAQDMSPSSHATLLLASSANMNAAGGYRFIPSSNSASVLQSGPVPDTPVFMPGAFPTSVSLPLDPRVAVHYDTPVPPHDSNIQEYSSATPFSHARHPRATVGAVDPSRHSIPSINTPQHRKAPLFPFPSEAAALHTLSRILRLETKKFRITDFIDLEEGEFAALVEAREAEAADGVSDDADDASTAPLQRKSMWDGEEEYETVTDCVRDKMEDEGGCPSRWKAERMERSEKRRRDREMRLNDMHLFGTHLEDLPDFALVSVNIGGYTHEVPTVVAACIEELIRSRLRYPKFFHSRPDRKQLFELVTRFDGLVQSNATHGQIRLPPSLREQSTQSVYALLGTYFSALPHTLIPRPLVDALWCWCVSPSVIRSAQRSRTNRNGEDEASESEHEASDDEDGDAPCYSARLRQRERDFLDLPSFRVQIRIARHVLLLLSRRQFSLLIYLMNFIRAVLHPDGDSDDEEGDRTSDGVALHDVARRFGGIILGGKDWKMRGSMKRKSAGAEVLNDNGRDRTSKEQKIMTWLVNHWGRVATAYEAEDYTPVNQPEERSRQRSASLSVKHQGSPPLSDPVPPRTQVLHTPAQAKRDRMPSECESLTSGSTVSDLEEIPIVSSQNIRPKSYFEKQNEQHQAASSLIVAPAGGDEDIFDYYCSSDPSHEGSQSQEHNNDPFPDDEASIYSCDSGAQSPSNPTSKSAAQAHDGGKPQQVPELPSSEADKLRARLEQALRERDDARQLVDAMRNIMRGSQV